MNNRGGPDGADSYTPRHDSAVPTPGWPGLERTQPALLFATAGATVVLDPFLSSPPYTH